MQFQLIDLNILVGKNDCHPNVFTGIFSLLLNMFMMVMDSLKKYNK